MNVIFSILMFIIVRVNVPADSEPGYRALTLLRSFHLGDQIYNYMLPYDAKNINNNDIFFALNRGEHEAHFCPFGEKSEDEVLMKKYMELRADVTGSFCLVSKQFMKGEKKICRKEPEPLVRISSRPGKPLQCGVEIPNTPENRVQGINEILTAIPKNRLMYEFQYKICGSHDTLNQWIKNNTKIPDAATTPMYYICYDHKKNTPVYTEHEILSPSLFSMFELEDQRKYDSKTLDTNPFFIFDEKQFLRLKNAYDNQKSADFRMVAYPMVPKKHMALGLWKKSTQHFLNTASLWEKLEPLMDLIDARILQIAVKENHKILVYTTAFSFRWKTVEVLYLDEGKEYIVPNTWCKVAYYPTTQTRNLAIAIFIQNTPLNTPGSNFYLCDEPYPCNFASWTAPNKLPQNISFYAKYAYCCKVTKYVQDIFPIELKLQGVLKLHKVFKTEEERLDNLLPDEDSDESN